MSDAEFQTVIHAKTLLKEHCTIRVDGFGNGVGIVTLAVDDRTSSTKEGYLGVSVGLRPEAITALRDALNEVIGKENA